MNQNGRRNCVFHKEFSNSTELYYWSKQARLNKSDSGLKDDSPDTYLCTYESYVLDRRRKSVTNPTDEEKSHNLTLSFKGWLRFL